MKPTQNLINGELYAILHKLAFPLEKRYSKEFYNRHFIIHVARRLQNELPDHVINASENESEYILRIDLPIEKKGWVHEPTNQNINRRSPNRTHFNDCTELFRRC